MAITRTRQSALARERVHLCAGVFSTGFAWMLILAIYLWHVAFGTNLGLLYNPFWRREASRIPAQ